MRGLCPWCGCEWIKPDVATWVDHFTRCFAIWAIERARGAK